MRASSRRISHLLAATAAVALLPLLSGCGGAASSASSGAGASVSTRTTRTRHSVAHRPAPPQSLTLHVAGTFQLPAARAGAAATAFGPGVLVIGGLDGGSVSTDTVFAVGPTGKAVSASSLPGAVHDAAAAVVGGRVLLFGGGVSEGSDRIVQVQPGTPHQIGQLPVALSDLDAVTIGNRAYVVGGWDGTSTNAAIFAVTPTGGVSTVAHLPLGVRYPAVGAVDGHVIIAGGETTDGTPTADVWSFDPTTGRVTPMPSLPAPGDHAAGAVLGRALYVISGLIRGQLTSRIIALRPAGRWASAGSLPTPLNNPTAAPLAGGIAVFGGRGTAGTTAAVTLLRAG